MSPDFTALLLTGIAFGAMILGFMAWRFGGANTVVFTVIAGLFPAVMDFLSSFVARNYEYPGQSRLWVFSYIFFGWIEVCGTCMLLAEGILARPGEDLLSQPRLLWQVPVAAGIIAVLLDLFIDPVAVVAGYWVWLVPGEVYTLGVIPERVRVASGDEIVDAQTQRIFTLARRMAKHGDLRAQRLRQLHPHVAEAAEAHDSNLVTCLYAKVVQR